MTETLGIDASKRRFKNTSSLNTFVVVNQKKIDIDRVAQEGRKQPYHPIQVDPSLLLKRQNAIKVVKGEIHNVLTLMRTDSRYASPMRFVEETNVQDHPLLQSFRKLHEELSAYPLELELQAATYLNPFCNAISGRDISASITGFALSSLHKFLLYGFIKDSEGMILITKSLLQCTFESESASGSKNPSSSIVHDVFEEQVVLKLLSLAALVVRCAVVNEPLLNADQICGLFDTCLHVSHRAKEASPLLRSAASDSLSQIILLVFSANVEKVQSARATILRQLATLLNPQLSTDATCVASLTLVNIALETMQSVTPNEVGILQDELCKYLLTWSTTSDLIILSLTLRVIFNLFQPVLRNQMKVPLEIFLTSVHIRMLDKTQKSFSKEQQEAVLESLLEFCLEPSLMQDLYLNYDCDVNCTNLFDSIVGSLTGTATPEGPSITAHNKLAIEGILAIIDSIARKCNTTENMESSCHSSIDLTTISDTDESDNIDEWEAEEAHKVAQERKRMKHVLQQVANEFNQNKKNWMLIGEELDLFPASPTPMMVASFLYNTPQIDKTTMGLYLGKGPEKSYPFHAKVRAAFCSLFDFKALSFSDSLRKFLMKFRLPGEAQCIDRLMEAFAKEMYDQQQECPKEFMLFNSADSVFRMAFSTIMLNTDLHNPGMKDEKRMTLTDFIRNNRGLNDGKDFPDSFISELYHDIKMNEIQVQKEFMCVVEVVRQHLEDMPSHRWEEILKRNIEAPFFTPAESTHSYKFRAGIHDRDMFVSVVKALMHIMSNAFAKSKDDRLVLKLLKGFKQMSNICIFFDLDETFNEILQLLLSYGRDYIQNFVTAKYCSADSLPINIATGDRNQSSTATVGNDNPIPKFLLQENTDPSTKPILQDVEGSAAHRGLLSLDCGFMLIQLKPNCIRGAWPTLVECICALRDAQVLPDNFVFLEDFSDSRGNLLPSSSVAKHLKREISEYYKSLLIDDQEDKSWFSMFFSSGETQTEKLKDGQNSVGKTLCPQSSSLLQVFIKSKIEDLLSMRSENLPFAKQTICTLLQSIDTIPYSNDALSEQNAVYSLELSLLALISKREEAAGLIDLFLTRFLSMMEKSQLQEEDIKNAFLKERVCVTILRLCIHLYDLSELKPKLMTCLKLLMDIPASFTRYIADRLACGMAIFLSQQFSSIESLDDWLLIGDMLDRLAFFGPGRGFIFDGIANTVESQQALRLAFFGGDRGEVLDGISNIVESPFISQHNDEWNPLSLEGSQVIVKLLLKFIFGKYEKDMSLCIPAMRCMDNLYRHIILLKRLKKSVDIDSNQNCARGEEQALWQEIAVAYYSICQNFDPEKSNQGADCFQRFIASTKTEAIADETWLTILHLVVMRQPSVKIERARINCCEILGKILLSTLAPLSMNRGNWEDLNDIVNHTILIVGENLREGRKGAVSPLFESTRQSITFLSNYLVSEEFTGDKEYGNWAADLLISELEKVGAGGGFVKNMVATRSI